MELDLLIKDLESPGDELTLDLLCVSGGDYV